MIQPQIDALLSWASTALEDIVEAKHEYFSATGGEVYEDDRSFEHRMQGFFNWYLFDRRGAERTGAGSGLTPVQRYLQERGAQLGGSDKDLLIGATQSRLSLYEFKGRATLLRRVPKGQVRVHDAITGDDFDVIERRQMHGLDPGDLLEARLLPVGGAHQFSSSFIFHPREMKRVILREVRKRRKAGALTDSRAFCWELEKMALQADRFRNVSIAAIYNFETPFLGHKKRAAEEAARHG